jgi:hypothetical protein
MNIGSIVNYEQMFKAKNARDKPVQPHKVQETIDASAS